MTFYTVLYVHLEKKNSTQTSVNEAAECRRSAGRENTKDAGKKKKTRTEAALN